MNDLIGVLLRDDAVGMLFALLDGDGEETRIAGGAVRDVLMKTMPHEVDFATTALPEEVMRRALAGGFRTVPTGLAHGTVTVIVKGRPFEVTTLRRDLDTDGRHAVVGFGRDWSRDAQRRDFTINGLFLDRAGRVHDHVGGLADIAARRVRFIGEARTRIREDYLRILRFFRFSAGYCGGAPDGEGLHAAIAERAGLRRLSRERIRAELLKLLAAPRGPEIAGIMADCGLLGALLGGVARTGRLARLASIEATLGRSPDAVLRLGAASLFVVEDADRLRERLKLSNADAARLVGMAEPGPVHDAGAREVRAMVYRTGGSTVRDRILLRWAGSDAAPDDTKWRALAEQADLPPPVFPLTGGDLIQWGVPAGPRLGELLRALEECWIAAGFPGGAGWKQDARAMIVADPAPGSDR